MIYLDYAATTPMMDVSIEAYCAAAREAFGNTSSLHDEGGKASFLLESSRDVIAKKLGVSRDGVIFTGSGTEGNILAILSLARAGDGKHVITSSAEHTSVHAAMNTLEREGYEITKLPLSEQGIVDVELLEKSIRPDTSLISIQHVNSEIGSIQPVLEIAKVARKYNIPYHVDCVQSFCKLDVTEFSKYVDAITVSAHKIGGPKGCGAVYLNPRRRILPLFPGVTHEKGLRGGTVDTPAVYAFATSVEHYQYDINKFWKLRNQLKASVQGTNCYFIEADEAHQLPSICGMCIKGAEGQYVMLRLNEEGICISTGSACDINSKSGTKAILAMGRSLSEARTFFRISFGIHTTEEEIQQLRNALIQIDQEIKTMK
ncbi:IscS subfamily cysteine desulfurase [Ureibacillus sp. FSL K6-8385]|uniref:Aminotransferase class V-fold PLP-dependent enzyme n=1 Tax=Ureibacillus terrenus TaxID=118246 RepID=A0A540V1I2_9BACL|nr:IscS subfamily cysteine desulfurase [Ureibacillus terrenus]MED3661980.1 IscS subfamily cysteine desulfurase [Ureibacillus terrenus]MED3764757.1 IscS subfamily cysteine desulfurase [Ureibacillus terrenus]TQE90609.1 aminotransferase class V-fold PLP-dependent enzyme [Ureibacillus terrenus]